MNNKKNNAMTICLAIMSLLVLGLGGYIVYDKVLSDKPSNENDNIKNDSDSNIDNSEKQKINDNNIDNSENQNNNDSDNNNSNEDIYEKLLNGDFSGVAGEYVNCDGEVITLLSNGLLQGEDDFTIEKPSRSNASCFSVESAYQWTVSNGELIRFCRMLVPIGESLGQVLTLNPIIKDDIMKIRIFSAQGIPDYNDIYYKK